MKEMLTLIANTVAKLRNEKGQGMVEYGLIIGLVSVAAIAALVLFGPKLIATFTDAANSI
jgi:pilus assembly protein Flp/PilA